MEGKPNTPGLGPEIQPNQAEQQLVTENQILEPPTTTEPVSPELSTPAPPIPISEPTAAAPVAAPHSTELVSPNPKILSADDLGTITAEGLEALLAARFDNQVDQ